ncbi:MAG TPA: type II toxin-antitoxin system RelE/ParE family toxin [Verrucomicrobiae bacterium]
MKIVFRPQFWIDVEEGVAYLAEKASPETARAWHAEVMSTVRRVEKLPDLGRPRHDLEPSGIRSLLLRRYPRYLLFYLRREDSVEFLRVKHGMMDLPALFGEERE